MALATDDAGVSRSSITQEYERAVETYHFSYSELKKMVRASLEYSFLPPSKKSAEEKQLEDSFARFEKEFNVPAKPTGQGRPAKKHP